LQLAQVVANVHRTKWVEELNNLCEDAGHFCLIEWYIRDLF